MVRCRVENCANSTRNPGSSSHFFMFPRDNELRRLWAQTLNIDVAQVKTWVVCSDHFTEENISFDGHKYILKKGSIPIPHPKCCVHRCKNFIHDGSPFKFFNFPAFDIVSNQWKLFTKKINFQPSLSSVICSAHFSSSQFNDQHKLKPDAVPDINVDIDLSSESKDLIELIEDERCRVHNCQNSTIYPGTALKFFQIPSDPERRLKWAEAIGADVSELTAKVIVCSDHFVRKDFVNSLKGLALASNAVPSRCLKGEKRCAVEGCENYENDDCSYKFYTFPTFENKSAIWEAFTKRKNFKRSKSSFICSAHFSIHQYNGDHLKPSAVPDVEGFDDFYDDENDADAKIELCEIASVPDEQESNSPKQTITHQDPPQTAHQEISETDLNKLWVVDDIIEMETNPASSHDILKASIESSLKKQFRLKIKMLQQKVRRQNKKISSLQAVNYVLKNRLKGCKCKFKYDFS